MNNKWMNKRNKQMNKQTDEWRNEWPNELNDRMSTGINECTDWMNEQQMNKWAKMLSMFVNEWTNEWKKKWTNEQTKQMNKRIERTIESMNETKWLTLQQWRLHSCSVLHRSFPSGNRRTQPVHERHDAGLMASLWTNGFYGPPLADQQKDKHLNHMILVSW